ncbi:MAG: TonB family protein [Candidatus Omnitrophica bacterium]|nr:TonB family protein [Candidatus Omnitrophota bacterium]
MLKKVNNIILGIIFFAINYSYAQTLFITQEYVGSILQKISSCLIYPTEALQKGWEGVVKVRFTISTDGRVKTVDIAESSGYPLLDAAAILAIKDASPYPLPKDFDTNKELEILLPVNYSRNLTEVTTDFSPETYFGLKPLSVISPNISPPLVTKEGTSEKDTPSHSDIDRETSFKKITTASSDSLILPKDPEIKGFIEIALKNFQPAQIAKQEVELAELKVIEAKRNLLPSAKISAYDSIGTAFKVDYEEREVKLTIEHPLYYGGRLQDALKQAQINLEITKRNYNRVCYDIIQKAETAFYYLVGGKMHYRAKQDLLKEAEQLFTIISHLTDKGMLVPLEKLTAESWLTKIQFQLDSIKQDNYMSELTFKQVLNVKETPVVKKEVLEVRRLNLDFDYCLELALNNRPEMYLSQLMVKLKEYGKNIELAKNKFSIDVTAAGGLYQGGYKSEKMRNSSTWNVGLKATKPLGANTLTSSVFSERVQKRLGQTQDTKASTVSGELGILDNLKRISEAKEADVQLARALSDFNETSKTITFEVQDAFLNYQKAILQLNEAEAEMKFRRHEFEVTKTRALVGEISITSAMESLFRFSEAQTTYYQAITNYFISIANLKKATGYSLSVDL